MCQGIWKIESRIFGLLRALTGCKPMNKIEVKNKRQEALKQAKQSVKRWYNNGWKDQVIYCYDIIYPDGSRDIGIKDKDNVNGFEFLYIDNAFAIVRYDGKLTVEKGVNQ